MQEYLSLNKIKYGPNLFLSQLQSNIKAFWDLTPCSFVDMKQRFGGICCLLLLLQNGRLFYPEDGSNRFY
jgi:hypothetical protein